MAQKLTMTPFGPGTIYVKPVGGAYKLLGDAQSFTFNIAKDVKELFGSTQNAIAVATSTIKLTGKLKKATFSAKSFNDTFFGQAIVAGQIRTSINEVGLIPSATAYTVTVAHSATFSEDLGVMYADGSASFTHIASGTPTVGQYTVTAGVYTFAAADAGVSVLISYDYTSIDGVTIDVNQQQIGTTVEFEMKYVTQHNGDELNIKLFKVIAPKLALDFKQTDFTIPDLDLVFFANEAKQVYIVTASA